MGRFVTDAGSEVALAINNPTIVMVMLFPYKTKTHLKRPTSHAYINTVVNCQGENLVY
jgi:hypothetical protein